MPLERRPAKAKCPHCALIFEKRRVGGEKLGSGHFQEFEDEYMEMMYQFHEKHLCVIRNRDLADAMGVKPASAEMVQRLASKGFLDYKPYKGVRLTDSGLIYGKRMKRRHRWRRFSSLPFLFEMYIKQPVGLNTPSMTI